MSEPKVLKNIARDPIVVDWTDTDIVSIVVREVLSQIQYRKS